MSEKKLIQELHIGNMISAELERQGRRVEWLARQIPCDKSNMYKMLKRPGMDIVLLVRISRILNHNFLEALSAWTK